MTALPVAGRLNTALLSPLVITLVWWRVAVIAADEIKRWAGRTPQPN